MPYIKAEDWTTEDSLDILTGWARDGLTDKQIATEKIGISERAFSRWKAANPSIVAALKKGKEPADVRVENALYKSATGFYAKVTEPVKLKTTRKMEGKGEITEEHIEMVEKTVYIPPNTTAQIFWLKNRKPDKWRDKQVVTTESEGQLAALIDGLKEE